MPPTAQVIETLQRIGATGCHVDNEAGWYRVRFVHGGQYRERFGTSPRDLLERIENYCQRVTK